ncbi:uncharacterized protein LOC117645743 [Thrips palmi]|uniref:Uncharacterized protein LOC117645743 n=1 Tax=Thrips palmi TaxID=161013 RepID=A0A6P8YPY0_THRPL|nr:uncharacterized protein LOC117645743 [Thrips palmi]
MRLLGLALVVCVVALAHAAPNKGAHSTKAAATASPCKVDGDCKKTVCGKTLAVSCDKPTKKCVCKAKAQKTKKPTTTTVTTPAAERAEAEPSPEDAENKGPDAAPPAAEELEA